MEIPNDKIVCCVTLHLTFVISTVLPAVLDRLVSGTVRGH